MSDEGQGHVETAPVIPAAAPFLRAGSLSLRGQAVIEKEARVAFQSPQIVAVSENKRRADEAARPIAARFRIAGIQENKVATRFRIRMVAVGGMEITDVVWRIGVRAQAKAPADRVKRFSRRANQFNARGFEKRHREK